MAANRDSFDAFTRPPDDPILVRFAETYKADIHRFFPDFALEPDPSTEHLLVLRNLTPVGLVTYEWRGNNTVYLHTDYVTPAYRDFKNGQSLYTPHTGVLAQLGVSRVRTQANAAQHGRYLRKMGFTPAADNAAIFEKTLI